MDLLISMQCFRLKVSIFAVVFMFVWLLLAQQYKRINSFLKLYKHFGIRLLRAFQYNREITINVLGFF